MPVCVRVSACACARVSACECLEGTLCGKGEKLKASPLPGGNRRNELGGS